MNKVKIKIKLLENCIAPQKMTEHAAGYDLFACLQESIELKPMERRLIPTGFIMEIPVGFEAQIRPRSGLAIKHGITCLNTPGTIDSDYRGEVKVILINLGSEVFTINHGDRIAQMVIARIAHSEICVVTELSDTGRSSGGFGSTGK